MPMIETRDGTWLYVKDWGKGNPVILIHGWPLSSDSWHPIAEALANAGHRVISYDRRGFGRSEQAWELIGFSMGGGEVARYMSRYDGAGIVRAILVSSVVPYLLQAEDNLGGVPQETFEQMTQDMIADRPAFMRTFLHDFFGIGWLTRPVSSATLEWAWNMPMQAGLRPMLKAAEAFSSTDFRKDLPAFKVPTLIIHGTADSTVPIDPTARMAAALIKDVRLVEYTGSPHGIFETDRDRLISDMLAFLNGEEPGSQDLENFVINPALPMGGY
ncbi:MAG: alpha/beta hydrolase [Sphingomonadales bacterium]|nr:alpha/beta hydrolase [Sphingomonadales bacterium]